MQFCRGRFQELCDDFGIQVVQSAPYSPSTNGAVEQPNNTLKRKIRAWCLERKQEGRAATWVDALPHIMCKTYARVNL
jgi:transposase InsO family protein